MAVVADLTGTLTLTRREGASEGDFIACHENIMARILAPGDVVSVGEIVGDAFDVVVAVPING